MKNVAEHSLGHYNTNNRVAAVGFFLAAHKVLRQHKVRTFQRMHFEFDALIGAASK